jgi:hypothetical protein
MKFDKRDKIEIEQRESFFKNNSFDPKFVANNWPLFVGKVPMGVFLARYEILKKTIDIPGHIAEFGSFNGSNLLYMAKVMQLLSPHNLKRMYSFDSFEGLTEISPEDKLSDSEKSNYKGNKELLEEAISVYDLDETIELQVGYIENTLPEFLNRNKHVMFSLIYIDTDLYSSTKIILEKCWTRLSQGGIIVFDEGYHDRFQGEGQALQEFLHDHSGSCEMAHVHFARQPMLYLVKK